MTGDESAWAPAADALRAVAPIAQERGIALGHDAHAALDASVAADREGLAQLLAMVLSQALLDAEPGTQIALVAVPAERAEGLRFEVRGGARLDDSAAIHKLAGRLGVRLDAGPPPAVTVALATRQAHSACPPPTARAADGQRALVLCIDDTIANVHLVLGVLRQRPNVETLFAHDAASGIRLAREHRPNLILLDLRLPDISGTTVLESLRADRLTARTPIAVVSADSFPGRSEEALRAGADAFLTKPIDVRKLLETVDRLIGP